jgi:hypothetical protein
VKHLVLCLLLALVSGCASYSSSFQKVEVLLSQQKPNLALAEHEKKPQSGKNELLYLLDKAMLQRMSGLYTESNATFEKTKMLIENLAATSVIEQVGAVTINDSMMSYEGEDYEQVAIHLYEALNYIKLGLWDEARVEALQVDVRLKKIAEENESKFEQDAFSRYLTGLIYEQGGESSDPMIAYRKAYQTYKEQKQPIPVFLKHDLLRLSQYLGLEDEYKTFKADFGIEKTLSAKELAESGEVVVLLHQSLAPIKRSESILVMGEKGVQLRISMPVYQSRPNYVHKARLTIGDLYADTVIVTDFDRAARKSLERHSAAMMARLLARAVLKKVAAKAAEDNGGSLAGLLVNAAGLVTETADTRSWLTLPKNIHFARLAVPVGKYEAKLTLLGNHNQVIQVLNLGSVELGRGDKVLLEQSFISPFVAEK